MHLEHAHRHGGRHASRCCWLPEPSVIHASHARQQWGGGVRGIRLTSWPAGCWCRAPAAAPPPPDRPRSPAAAGCTPSAPGCAALAACSSGAGCGGAAATAVATCFGLCRRRRRRRAAAPPAACRLGLRRAAPAAWRLSRPAPGAQRGAQTGSCAWAEPGRPWESSFDGRTELLMRVFCSTEATWRPDHHRNSSTEGLRRLML